MAEERERDESQRDEREDQDAEQGAEEQPAAEADEDHGDDGEDAGDSESAGSDDSDQDAEATSDGKQDISDTTAPSIGPNTKIEREDPEERLARHEQSDTDAMGLDKRREVIGGSYSPSIARQAAMYGIAIAVTAGLVIGLIVLTNELDQPPKSYPDEAPWSQASAEEKKPAPIDFPEYGHPGSGEQVQGTPGESSGSPSSENVTGTETP